MLYVLLAGVSLLVVAGLLLIQPYVTRPGLLFGVYVGEAAWRGATARSITAQWTRGMVGSLAAGLAVGWIVAGPGHGAPPLAVLAALGLVLVTSFAVYLRAYRRAQAMAVTTVPIGAAAVAPDAPDALRWPVLAVIAAAAAGSAALGYAWLEYGRMPPIVPTHFGPSGRPDAWSPRSFASVMLLPIAALVVPVTVGVFACLTARAKRAIRRADAGVSLDAQVRFRRAMASFLSGVTVLVGAMLSGMAIAGTRTALGLQNGMPPWLMWVVGAMVLYVVGGSVYLSLRYGQGGARLEGRATEAPLTNGIADNARWYLGAFYVNRDDPSIMVEKRFGVGYTVNFGNPRAVALVVGCLVVVLAIVVTGLLMAQQP